MTFDRAPGDYKPLIEAGWSLLTPTMKRELTPRFLCGVDPGFVGLHRYQKTRDGRSYSGTAHACYQHHTADGQQRIVLPHMVRVKTIVHEAAHMYDEVTHFELDAPETTAYSTTKRAERIAEAIRMILYPPTSEWAAFVSTESFRPLRQMIGAAG